MKALGAGCWAVLFVVTEAAAQPSSLNRPGSGARAAGMGNAFIAVSDDGTAASWNPAGLTQLRKPEFSLVYAVGRSDQARDGYRTFDRTAVFTNLKSSSTAKNLEFASAALPFSIADRPITLQASWRRLYQVEGKFAGTTTRRPIAESARPESVLRFDNSADGAVDLWSVAGAVRLTGRLSLGVSFDFYDGDWGETNNISESPGFLGPTDFLSTGVARQIGGHTVAVGLLLAYPSIRVGAVYHGPLKTGLEVKQFLRSNLTEPIDRNLGEADGVRLRFPSSLGLGVAWLPQPLLRLAVDLTYDRWTKFLLEGDPDSPDRLVSGFDGLPPELSATRNTVTLNAGLERLLPVKGSYVPVRVGFTREPQGARDPYFRENAMQTVVAGGTGINSNSLKFDLSLEYRWGGFRNAAALSPIYAVGGAEVVGLPLPPEAEGFVRTQDWRLKLSVIYRITNPERIGEILRKAFGS